MAALPRPPWPGNLSFSLAHFSGGLLHERILGRHSFVADCRMHCRRRDHPEPDCPPHCFLLPRPLLEKTERSFRTIVRTARLEARSFRLSVDGIGDGFTGRAVSHEFSRRFA